MSAATPPGSAEARRELACAVALASLEGIGPATVLACLRGCGTEEAWAAVVAGRATRIPALASALGRRSAREPGVEEHIARHAAAIDPGALLERHERAGQRVAAYGTPGYPERLVGDVAPPAVVFWQGSLGGLDRPTVAIVGTRNATRLGFETASRLAVELVDRGVSVVSGLALGIDGAAHRAVVERRGGGVPIGVVATGLESTYPRRHQRLHRQVAAAGLLLSESPIGSEPSRWRFPARNRIIAGLSDAVVVVESRSAGGSMLTAAEAVARDRTVLAVPGHPTSAAAAGTLDLIADGAVPVRDVTDVLVAIGLGGQKPIAGPGAAPLAVPGAPVSPLAASLLEHLDPNPMTLGELVLTSATGVDEASAALLELERAGLVTRSGAWFERARVVGRPSGPAVVR
ncbi:MAG TPA: DNA-processing protein DprA [Acidimicrobiales bacterium]|nr:DNA-processing protein DprA [Acidimicrobiales bacterium]